MKRVALTLIAAYAAVGLFLGEVMARVIPAMNQRGALYYAATWPAWVSAGSLYTPAPPIPSWCFTFERHALTRSGGPGTPVTAGVG